MLNKVTLIGRLGQDPEMKNIGSGQTVTNLSIATTEKWKDKDGKNQERTEWHRVNVWGKLAEVCAQNLSKGRMVYVEGRLQTRSWDDKGVKKYVTEIVSDKVIFLGDKEKSQDHEKQPDFNSDDSPF